MDKEALIDRLLDFLGAPGEDLTKSRATSAASKQKQSKASKPGSAKKKTPTKKKSTKESGSAKKKSPGKKATKAKPKVEDDDDAEVKDEDESEEKEETVAVAEEVETLDMFAELRNHKKGEKPSDDCLRQWVKAYVVCFDMQTASKCPSSGISRFVRVVVSVLY